MITETFSESKQAASARSIYVALTELASDLRTESFTANKALIAHRAGVSVKTAETLLKGLHSIGVIHVETQRQERNAGAIKAANVYTLRAIRNDCASHPTEKSAMRNDYASTMRNGGTSSTSDKVEEHFQEHSEEKERTRTVVRALSDFESLGYDQDSSEKLENYERVCVRAGVGFLPVDQFNVALAVKLSHFEDLKDWEALLSRAVALVRGGAWPGESKTLRRILEEALSEDFSDDESPPDDNDIPF